MMYLLNAEFPMDSKGLYILEDTITGTFHFKDSITATKKVMLVYNSDSSLIIFKLMQEINTAL